MGCWSETFGHVRHFTSDVWVTTFFGFKNWQHEGKDFVFQKDGATYLLLSYILVFSAAQANHPKSRSSEDIIVTSSYACNAEGPIGDNNMSVASDNLCWEFKRVVRWQEIHIWGVLFAEYIYRGYNSLQLCTGEAAI